MCRLFALPIVFMAFIFYLMWLGYIEHASVTPRAPSWSLNVTNSSRTRSYYSNVSIREFEGYTEGYGTGHELEGRWLRSRTRQNNVFRCPNLNYIMKHFCMECRDAKMALDWARIREELLESYVAVSHVFAGNDTEFELTDNGNCVNALPAICWRCDMIAGQCRLEGLMCFMEHDPFTGHLFVSSIRCVD